jgi:hypothetical protein
MKTLIQRMFRYRRHLMVEGPFLTVEYWPGDDWMRASLHLNHRWFGRHYWHVLFLPDFLP